MISLTTGPGNSTFSCNTIYYGMLGVDLSVCLNISLFLLTADLIFFNINIINIKIINILYNLTSVESLTDFWICIVCAIFRGTFLPFQYSPIFFSFHYCWACRLSSLNDLYNCSSGCSNIVLNLFQWLL